jgi:hypothetical protein
VLGDFEVSIGSGIMKEAGLRAEAVRVDVDGRSEDDGGRTGVRGAKLGDEVFERREVAGAGEVDEVV